MHKQKLALWYGKDGTNKPLSPDFLKRRTRYYNSLEIRKTTTSNKDKKSVSTWKVRAVIGATYSKIADIFETVLDKQKDVHVPP